MIRVARNSWNTLTFKKVTVSFREYPGRGAEGAIERATYTLNAGITMVAGATRSDGSITIRVPAGGSTDLEIFGSRYRISLGPSLEPVEEAIGTQRRLAMVGYRFGAVDGTVDRRAEAAVQSFQADQRIDPRGLDNSGIADERTRNALKEAVGD